MRIETRYDELRFLTATIALEALIEVLPRKESRILRKAKFKPVRDVLLLTINNWQDGPDHARAVYQQAVKQVNRRTFREGIYALLEHHDVRHDDLLEYVGTLNAERNNIVHRSAALALTSKFVFVVREIITQIVLKELHYQGPYECYLGESHTRPLPECRANVH